MHLGCWDYFDLRKTTDTAARIYLSCSYAPCTSESAPVHIICLNQRSGSQASEELGAKQSALIGLAYSLISPIIVIQPRWHRSRFQREASWHRALSRLSALLEHTAYLLAILCHEWHKIDRSTERLEECLQRVGVLIKRQAKPDGKSTVPFATSG